MLKSTLSYIVIRTLSESILLILAGFILLNLKIDKVKIIKLGIVLGISISGIRMLPITYGIHTILGIMLSGLILANVSKLPIIQPMMAITVIFIVLAISEVIYIRLANIVLNISLEVLMVRDLKGAILSIPSLLIFISIVIMLNFILSIIKSKMDIMQKG